MKLVIEDKAVGYEHCKECRKDLKKWKHQMIGLCHRCYQDKFPSRENTSPALWRKVKGGLQRLVSPDERLRWQKPYDEVIERIDRENADKREVNYE